MVFNHSLTAVYSKFFPPVVSRSETDQEQDQQKSTDTTELAAKLPDPPTTEPTNPEEPSLKKQKTEGEDDFVVVNEEDIREANEAAPKADL